MSNGCTGPSCASVIASLALPLRSIQTAHGHALVGRLQSDLPPVGHAPTEQALLHDSEEDVQHTLEVRGAPTQLLTMKARDHGAAFEMLETAEYTLKTEKDWTA